MKYKSFFIIIKGLLLKQTKNILKGKSPTLKEIFAKRWICY